MDMEPAPLALSKHVLDEEPQNIVLVWGNKMALG
jgi:hypothetical protein